MQVIIHAGVHCTGGDRLVKCLLRNSDLLRSQGTVVPGPSRYRGLLAQILGAAREAPLAQDAREVFLDAILDDDHVERLVLSDTNFFATDRGALAWGMPYARASEHLAYLRELMQGDEVELYLGLRDPATWIPAVYKFSGATDYRDFLGGCDPLEFRWSEMVERILEEVPGLRITAWCNEDTPLTWGQIVRDIGGLDSTQKIKGAFDILTNIMAPEGTKRFRAYLKQHPQMPEIQKRRVMAAFLAKYVEDDKVEEELDLPGWSPELVETMTEGYEEDVYRIARLPGVTLISP
ncbi:hypothetical protein [Mesobacterium pallidum]|uniref:hypothetical protein n=1 Tax=Mesobacterium pallidum TaxID=2872037 RepID=UPI001EE38D99|nr:hypothetical protein [Mesobacterium pallidum]